MKVDLHRVGIESRRCAKGIDIDVQERTVWDNISGGEYTDARLPKPQLDIGLECRLQQAISFNL
jgi:hypothetical protein